MKVYTHIQNILDKNSLKTADKIDNCTYSIADNEVIADADLPKITANQAYQVSGNPNTDGYYTVSNNVVVVSDFRGHDAYDKNTREKVEIKDIGDLPKTLTMVEPPSPYHTFKNNKWILSAKNKEQQLQDAKQSKLAQLNSIATNIIETATKSSDTPAFERATWSIQGAEAIAWHSDNSTPTPNLDRIANGRGIPVDILRQKAYEKAINFEHLTSTMAGKRQKIEDSITRAKNMTELDKITVDLSL